MKEGRRNVRFAFCFDGQNMPVSEIERMFEYMKLEIKRLLTVVLAVALIVGVGYFSWDDQLRASEDDGTVTAAQQQEQAEQTLAPVEVVVPEETPAEEVAAEAPADPFQNAWISVSLLNDGELYYGDVAKLWAQVSGVEGNGAYRIQWQTDDGNGWVDIPGATGPSYNFSLNGSNATRPYRAVMICQN